MIKTPHIKSDVFEFLLRLALVENRDYFGYRDFGGPADDSNKANQTAFMQELVIDALTARKPSVVEHLKKQRNGRSAKSLDEITAELLFKMGIHPGSMLTYSTIMAREGTTVSIYDPDSDNKNAAILTGTTYLTVNLGKKCKWTGRLGDAYYNRLSMPLLPKIISNATQGLSLSNVLTHPLFDQKI